MDGSSTFAIINAELFDGTGAAPFQADVVVENDRIRAVAPTGTLNLSAVDQKIDADGLSLSPGFIDIHSHSDNTVILDPACDSKISQGVTTDVVGNCGTSYALIFDRENRRRASMRLSGGLTDWRDFAGYAASVERRGPAMNIVSLVGHNSIRDIVMGMRSGEPTAAELAEMKQILYDALQQGAAGLSSGLAYIPGKYADTGELCQLASLLKGTGKPYATHMRSESTHIREALKEAFTIAAAGDGKLQISHFKTVQKDNWHLIDEILQMVEDAKKSGLQITADRYPYLHFGTGLIATLPEPWCRIADLREHLKDPAAYRELHKVMTAGESPLGIDFNGILLSRSDNPDFDRYNGISITAIAKDWGVPPGEAYLRLICGSTVLCAGNFQAMCAKNLDRFLALDYLFAGSDGSAYPFDVSPQRLHPRNYGAIPRFFRLASRLAPPEKVIARMTSRPAAVMQIPERGIITPGYFADLVLFDREHLNAPADFSDPHHIAEGINKVFVAGGLAFTCEDIRRRGRFGHFIKIRNRNSEN